MATLDHVGFREYYKDTHYRTFASGISAPGRNLQLSLRVQW